jgi:hypothetical protein
MDRYSFVGESDMFGSYAEYGFYLAALDWCMRDTRYQREVPTDWFVPDNFVRANNGQRYANALVANDIWKKVSGGYVFGYIYKKNTPDVMRRRRRKWRDEKKPGRGYDAV